jgi:Uma2 family endonuclease
MSLPELKHPGYTIEDWKSWEGRWELISGVAYDMTPAPGTEHQAVSVKLTLAIGTALEEARRKHNGGDCQLFHAPTDVFLASDIVVQPDLLIVCDPSKVTEQGIEGAPDLVVEILSPSTASKDLTTKRWLYETAKVPEYLIIYLEEQRAELLRLGTDGFYQTSARIEWGQVIAILNGKLSVTLN